MLKSYLAATKDQVIVYLSPLSCINIWDAPLTTQSFAQVFPFHVSDHFQIKQLFEIESTSSLNLLASPTFMFIIVQKTKMQLPIGILQCIDFIPHVSTVEYMSHKLIVNVEPNYQNVGLAKIKSILQINWQHEDFTKSIFEKCKVVMDVSCYLDVLIDFLCSDDSTHCIFRIANYSSFMEMLHKSVIDQTVLEGWTWNIDGVESYSIFEGSMSQEVSQAVFQM